jgi:methylenetetrahydrofolate reductase (NADPH)
MQNLSKSIKLSFELFPPKMWNNAVKDKYASLIKALVKFHPTFISCTYGANGGTKTNTLNVLQLIKQCGGVPLAHCTVANQEFADVENFIKDVKDNGISKILCLRGDLNGDDTNVMHASDLMQYVKDKYAN